MSLRYFPVPALSSGTHRFTMDAKPDVGCLVEVDENFAAHCKLKRDIVASAPGYYFQCPPDAVPLAWEAVKVLLPHVAAHLPDHFALEVDGGQWRWTNRLLGTCETFTPGDQDTVTTPPLRWLASQLQEDLILLRQEGDNAATVAAGHLCFGAGWCIGDKMGLPFLAVHAPVPGFEERAGMASDLLLRRLKSGRPVGRVNWSVTAGDTLNQSPLTARQWQAARNGITAENALDRVFLRLERQTLSRLPRTGGILFTIHTYLHPLREVVADADHARRLYAALRSFPPALIEYKGMTAYYPALMESLSRAV